MFAHLHVGGSQPSQPSFGSFGGYGGSQPSFGGVGSFGGSQPSFGGFGSYGGSQPSFGGFGSCGGSQPSYGGFGSFGGSQPSSGGSYSDWQGQSSHTQYVSPTEEDEDWTHAFFDLNHMPFTNLMQVFSYFFLSHNKIINMSCTNYTIIFRDPTM